MRPTPRAPPRWIVYIRHHAARRDQLVACLPDVVAQPHVAHWKEIVEVDECTGTDDRRRDARLVLHPQHSELDRRDSCLLRESHELVAHVDPGFVDPFRIDPTSVRCPLALRKSRGIRVAAGEHTLGDGRP